MRHISTSLGLLLGFIFSCEQRGERGSKTGLRKRRWNGGRDRRRKERVREVEVGKRSESVVNEEKI